MLNEKLTYYPAIPLLGIYQKEMKICPHKNYAWVFIATLFIIKKIKLKETKYISTDEFMNKMWLSHTIGNDHAIKMNELLIHPEIWMNLEKLCKGTGIQ